VANAIDTFKIRLRNEGYPRPGLKCLTPNLPPMLGYAATCRVKAEDPPVGHTYYDRKDWWDAIERQPSPRVAVIKDIDTHPGFGSSVGEVHASILKVLGCAGVITNGSVRNVSKVSALGFRMFGTGVSVSQSYIHMVDSGGPVEICGLTIRTGDLLYADFNGLLSIPIEIAADIPGVAAQIERKRKTVIDLCQSPDFSLESLRKRLTQLEP